MLYQRKWPTTCRKSCTPAVGSTKSSDKYRTSSQKNNFSLLPRVPRPIPCSTIRVLSLCSLSLSWFAPSPGRTSLNESDACPATSDASRHRDTRRRGKIFLDTRVPVTQHYTIRKWERLFLLVKIAWGDRTNILVQIIWGHELVVWRWCLQNVHGVKLILQQDLGVSGSIFVGLQWCSADLHSFCSSMRKHDRLLWRSIRL